MRSDTVPGALWNYSGGGYTVAQLLVSEESSEQLPGLASEARVDRSLVAPNPATPDSALAGVYRVVVRGQTRTYTVSWGGDVLSLYDGGGEPRRLTRTGPDEFFALNSPTIFAFERDGQGRGRTFALRPARGPAIVAPRVE